MSREATRRRYLIAVGAGASGLAGCTSDDDGGNGGGTVGGTDGDGGDGTDANGGDGGTDDGTEPHATTAGALEEFPDLEAGEPTFRRWLPADGEFAAGLSATNYERYRAVRSTLPASEYDSATDWAATGDYAGVAFDGMDAALASLSGPGIVYPGSFDRDAIDETLRGTGYERDETRDGVAFYRRTEAESPSRFAVADEGVVNGVWADPETFPDQVLPLFEAARGERERYHETSEIFRRFTDAVGWPLVTGGLQPGDSIPTGLGGLPIVPEAVAASVTVGEARYLVDDELVHRYWLWTREDGDASPSEVREALDERGYAGFGEAHRGVAVRTEGRVNDVAVVTPIENPGGGSDPLQFTLRATLEGTTLRLEHRAGDAIPVDRLSVRAGGDEIELDGGSLEPGGTETVAVPGGAAGELVVVYSGPGGGTEIVAEA